MSYFLLFYYKLYEKQMIDLVQRYPDGQLRYDLRQWRTCIILKLLFIDINSVK